MRLIITLAISLLLCACMVSDTDTLSTVFEDRPIDVTTSASVDWSPQVFSDVPMASVKSFAWSQDGTVLLVGFSGSYDVLRFNMNTGAMDQLKVAGYIRRMALNYTHNLLAVQYPEKLRIYDLTTERLLAAMPIENTYYLPQNPTRSDCVKVLPGEELPETGCFFISRGEDSESSQEFPLLNKLNKGLPLPNFADVLEWSANDHLSIQDHFGIYFTISGESVLKVWVKDRGLVQTTVAEMIQGDDRPIVRAWQWSPNGQKLAVSLSDGSLQIWDSGNNSVDTWQNVAGGVLTFSPSGSQIAVSGSKLLTLPDSIRISAEISVLDVKLPGIYTTIPAGNSRILDLLWTQEGNRLVAATDSGEVDLWDMDTQEHLATKVVAANDVTRVFTTSDPDIFVTTSSKGTISRWRFDTEPVEVLLSPSDLGIGAACLSGDGSRYLAVFVEGSGSETRRLTMEVRGVDSGQLIGKITGFMPESIVGLLRIYGNCDNPLFNNSR